MPSIDRIISETVATTGEVLEYPLRSPSELTKAFIDVEAHLKAYNNLKRSMLNLSMDILIKHDMKGESDGNDNHTSPVQPSKD